MIYDKVNNLKDNISMKRERLSCDRTLKKLIGTASDWQGSIDG